MATGSACASLALVGLLAFGTAACTQDGASPGSPPELDDAAERPPAAGPGFRIAEDFRWADTLLARRVPIAISPLEHGSLGLFRARDFRIASGQCRDCATPAAALWHFRDDIVAVPRAPESREPESSSVRSRPSKLPPLVWIAAPEVVEEGRLARDGSALVEDGVQTPLLIAPRLPTNTAYTDLATVRFFAERPIRVRGATRIEDGRAVFVARTIWPTDARIDVQRLEPRPLGRNEWLATLIEAQWGGTTDERFPARLLFERHGAGRDWDGKAVLAFVLSGAQGDDDGSRAGHLAIATGVFGPKGEWRDWLVDDFYPLDDPSPKGIISAPVPIDNYLFDFNSGQLYYRPAYMLVAVLAEPRAAVLVQTALEHSMLRYYCRAVGFDLARHNSTAFSIDPLRELGWRIPTVGPTSTLAALIAAPLTALAERSLESGEDVYSALATEKTRLLPRVAFEVLGRDLLDLAEHRGRRSGGTTSLEGLLVDDVEAVLFVRLPQVPSARRQGTYPERSLLVYGARLLSDPGPFERQPKGSAAAFPSDLAESCGPASR